MTLDSVRAFAREIAQGSWFAACGEELQASESAEVALYLAALGMAATEIARAASWTEAAAITRRQDWSREWWATEATAERALRAAAAERFGETPLLAALSVVTEAADALHGAAALAAGRAGIADPALTRVAAGAAAQACHQQALALAAGAGANHLFTVKYRIFAGGRWLLGVIGGRCFLF